MDAIQKRNLSWRKAAAKKGVRAEYRSADSISPQELLEMHGLFKDYYDNADIETFARDLANKDGLIIAHDGQTGAVKGFSTLKRINVPYKGKTVRGIFSGDTITHKSIWGSRHMHMALLRFLVTEKFRKPTEPLYWFLISKGYKTYLLMANNFDDYYPRYDKQDDGFFQTLVEAYCDYMYPGKYNAEKGVLELGGEQSQHLKGEVTPITEEIRQKEPKIRFFEECNPNWKTGDELPCVGEMTYGVLYKAGIKFLTKKAKR